MNRNNHYGFSLLEVVLSLGIAALVLMSIQQILVHFLQRDGWWQMLNSMIVTQQTAHKTLTKLHESACQRGLLVADTDHWRLKLAEGDDCVIYDVRFGQHNGQWQKRRYQGRYASFLAHTQLLQVSYGVVNDEGCQPTTWLTQVDQAITDQVVMIKLDIATGVSSQAYIKPLPHSWYAQVPNYAQATGEVQYWMPLTVLIPLPCSA